MKVSSLLTLGISRGLLAAETPLSPRVYLVRLTRKEERRGKKERDIVKGETAVRKHCVVSEWLPIAFCYLGLMPG